MHMDQDRIEAAVQRAYAHAIAAERAKALQQDAELVAPPAPAAPATPPGQLTVEGGNRAMTVTLPTMNRSWKTGEFWLAGFLAVLPLLADVMAAFEPALDTLANSPGVESTPLAGAAIFVGRQIYKGVRMWVAASVAKAEVKA